MSTEAVAPEGLTLSARNATLADLAGILKDQHNAKHDVVVPATAIRSSDGVLVVDGAGPDGPGGAPGSFRPTEMCDEGLSDKLRIPREYLRRMRNDRPDLYDANVNGWLRGTPHYPLDSPIADPDPRRFLLRCFNGPEFGEGIARAFLSQNFKIIDNLDVLTAALDGAREASAEIEVMTCDLTEKRMTVNLYAPEVSVLAPLLLANYRSPFTGQPGSELPVISAGLCLSNSETGGAAYQIVPRIVVRVCKNGATITKDAVRAVHLGARMDEGVVRWSHETQQRNVELVRAQTADAVRTFLDVAYLQNVVDGIEGRSARVLDNPAKTIEVVAARLKYSDSVREGILDHFIKGGDTTAGGVFQAVTSFAQVVEDADVAFDLEASALAALEEAYAAA